MYCSFMQTREWSQKELMTVYTAYEGAEFGYALW